MLSSFVLIMPIYKEPVTNTLKLQLQKAETVTKAIELCRSARSAGWAIILGCSEDGIESNDCFLADFAGLYFVLFL